MKKIIVCIFFALCPSILFAGSLKSIPWEELPNHISDMNIEAQENIIDCPQVINESIPFTTVIQWIENTQYKWNEYMIGDQIFIQLEKPVFEPLTKEKAEILLKASSLWMVPVEIQPEATSIERAVVPARPLPQTAPKEVELNNLQENESVSSPVNLEATKKKTVNLQNVFGVDDRIEVGTSAYPFNTIAYVLVEHQGNLFRGTAFLVSPYVALTNAHIVYDYDTGSWADSVEISPGQYENLYGQAIQPYGTKIYHSIYTNTFYQQTGKPEYDYGAIKIYSPFSGISTFMPLKFNYDIDNNSTILNLSGYHSVVKGYDTFSQWHASGYSSYYTTTELARYYIDASSGSSGSPVWLYFPSTDTHHVVAINAFSQDGMPNGGPRLNYNNQSLIEPWVSWTPPNLQPTPSINSPSFDPSFYLSKYPDLAAAGYTTANVQNHWNNSGIQEGRQGSEVFDVKFYLQKYPDLQLAYGNNYFAAHTHWQYNGIYEGRQGSATFAAKSYLQRYPDLQQAFGNDYKAAALHYLNSGKQEGRNGAP
jgi:V8-like Glu-specific endopeptidase